MCIPRRLQRRKDLLSNGKDMSSSLSRKPVIEHANFEGSRSVLLRDQGARVFSKYLAACSRARISLTPTPR